ncbi:MAG: hypothetical protein COV10_01550 [Candidatus Vogelbacteria bacterium CG10_big_fil_rev_8_21_14_0_10_51_16]|uniref:Mercury ion transport protein n=1 Tax=Candidatus Vogelbacteria bacterium CG10_big_fil_rev_8_21_14_0_10_51_16 TaxID=1975045 RepID=A0A2H0REW6_9BACT|nr:MAG: hypothetical protein COV10_01550 [Candidatus Vogelbacteria bacterium CG10_big_fil_rev_8_21_14_0_10_51_16]
MHKLKEVLSFSWAPVVLASLCCLSPVIFVLLGVSTISFAGSLADTLYGDYKWLFRTIGLLALLASFVVYLRRAKGICTIDEAKKRRNEILNYLLLSLIVGIVGYFFFLYVVVEYIGIGLGIWG